MEKEQKNGTAKILIVDDILTNVAILENIVQSEGYIPLCAMNVQEALDIMKDTMPQLILSDFSMPGMNGLEFCRLLKSNPRTRDIPFIFITVADSSDDKKAAFSAGAADFIPKPFEPVEVIMRVGNHLKSYWIKQELKEYNRMMHKTFAEQKKRKEMEQRHILSAMSKAVGNRSGYNENHIKNVKNNCRILAQSLQLVQKYEKLITEEFIETIGPAAVLCDVGNIAIPDSMLLNGDIPDEKRQEAARIHSDEGVKILEEIRKESSSEDFLDMAVSIVKYRHARWDGTGYPENVRGKEIPLAARIAAIVNDFDDLLTGRCNKSGGYPAGCPVEKSIEIINAGSGNIYDPHIVEVFNKIIKQLRTV